MQLPSPAEFARTGLSVLHAGRLLRLRARLPLIRHRPLIVWGDESWTYARVYREAKRYAQLFREHREKAISAGRLGKNEQLTIGLYRDNSPAYLFACFGAALEGDLILALNTGFRGEILAKLLEQSGTPLVLTDTVHAGYLEQALDGVPQLERGQVLVDDGPPPEGMQSLPRALEAASPAGGGRRPRGADPLLVIYTSGTTGTPKGIPCSHLKLLGAGAVIGTRIGLRRDDRGYIAMPLFHSNAWLLAVMPTLFAGASFVLKPKFSASAFADDVLEHHVTWMNYVGQPVHYILAALEQRFGSPERITEALAHHPDNCLRIACGNGASAVDREKFMRYFYMEHIYEVYGSTEAVISTMLMPGDPPDSVGSVPKSVIILDDNGNECPPAEVDSDGRIRNYDEAVGEICARINPNNLRFDGYFGNPEATNKKYDGNIYHSGDLGHIRKVKGKRYLYFDGRTDDWIRKDGENFSADTVAHFAQALPGVHLAAAYGVPDPVADERVTVALQMEPGERFDPQAVFDHFLKQQEHEGMDPKWMPDFIRIEAELPMSETNKILVKNLRREGYNLDLNPDMAIWFRERSDTAYKPLTRDAFERLKKEFEENGRVQALVA